MSDPMFDLRGNSSIGRLEGNQTTGQKIAALSDNSHIDVAENNVAGADAVSPQKRIDADMRGSRDLAARFRDYAKGIYWLAGAIVLAVGAYVAYS